MMTGGGRALFNCLSLLHCLSLSAVLLSLSYTVCFNGDQIIDVPALILISLQSGEETRCSISLEHSLTWPT